MKTSKELRKQADQVGFAIVEKVIDIQDQESALLRAKEDLKELMERRARLLEWADQS